MTATQATRPARSGRTDPLSREALFRQVGSLVGVVLLGFLSMSIRQVSRAQSGGVLRASTLTVVIVAAILMVPWHRGPGWAHQLMPFVLLFATSMTVRATGGIHSDLTQLVFLPVLWVAVYGRTSEVAATIIATAFVLILPMIGGVPTEQETLRTFAMVAGGAALGLIVHRFFDGIRGQTSRLRFLAGTDALTGAANRRAWDEELASALARADRDGGPLSVALLDLDDFKGFNDRYGHQAGDILLKEVSAAWQGTLRVGDILARTGGDEFAVLLPGCERETARVIAERLRGCVRAARCSVGVATWDRVETADALLKRADAALYQAKEQGRDRVVVVLEPDLELDETISDDPGIILTEPSNPPPRAA